MISPSAKTGPASGAGCAQFPQKFPVLPFLPHSGQSQAALSLFDILVNRQIKANRTTEILPLMLFIVCFPFCFYHYYGALSPARKAIPSTGNLHSSPENQININLPQADNTSVPFVHFSLHRFHFRSNIPDSFVLLLHPGLLQAENNTLPARRSFLSQFH